MAYDTARCTREHAEERFGDALRLMAAILSNVYFRCEKYISYIGHRVVQGFEHQQKASEVAAVAERVINCAGCSRAGIDYVGLEAIVSSS
jgi:hypothetical protein